MPAQPGSLPRQAVPLAAAVALGATAAGCGQPQAWGEANSLIVVAPEDLWAQVEDTTYAALEPTIFTTREEKRFVVTHVDPGADEWSELRRFRNIVLFGPPDDPLVRQAADEADRAVPSPPAVLQARDVFARGQTVTAVVLDPERPAESWREQLGEAYAQVDSAFRDYARERMFVTGRDTALARQLQEEAGFELVVPQVYRHLVPSDSTHVFRNDNPDPSQLIRSVLVSWTEALDTLTAEAAYEWRRAVGQEHYVVPQRIDTAQGRVERFERNGRPALEASGIWEDEESGAVPAAGPFIAWLVQCGERTYFLDAWLYAPGAPKYEYMLQLREILNSFRC